MYYGQGATKDFIKKETEGFFRAIDAALIEALKLEKAPLVLAALDGGGPGVPQRQHVPAPDGRGDRERARSC